MVYVAILVALFALALMGLGWLVGHRTFLPAMSQPGLLWWPGLGLLLVALLIAVLPSYFRYTTCEWSCDLNEGKAEANEINERFLREYDDCVGATIESARRRAIEQVEGGADLDLDQVVKTATLDAAAACTSLTTGRCVRFCYAPEEGF